jgi:stress-induced morphogen
MIKPMEILFDNAEQPEPRVSKQAIVERIELRLTDAQVSVYDLTGGGDHYQLEVTSPDFAGKSPVARHRMVYAALSDLLSEGSLHALALSCKVPAGA